MHGHQSVHRRISYYASRDVETLYRDFGITAEGYNERQVEISREQYGRNMIVQRNGDTIRDRLRRAFFNPFSVILMMLAAIAFVADTIPASGYSRDMTTSLILLLMLLAGGGIRFSQEMHSKHVADRLSGVLRTEACVWRNNKWNTVSSEELVVGDRVRLSSGVRVPADLRLVETNRLFVSQAVITGESAALEKRAEIRPEQEWKSLDAYDNIAFMGSAVIGGTGIGIVLSVGRDTVYGGCPTSEPNRKSQFDKGANSIAWVFIRFMVILIPVVFLACGLTKGNWAAAFLFALSVAVGLTPEMLPMVINACLVKGSISMRKKQTVVKNINAMQGFGSMDILCVDKTGTLTGDRIVLEYYLDILGNEERKVLEYACLNSMHQTSSQNHLDVAIRKYRDMPGFESRYERLMQTYQKLDEAPFDYKRKTSGVLVKREEETILIVKGNVNEVCGRCTSVEYKGRVQKIEEDGEASVRAVVDEMLQDGMKVLAVAYKKTEQETIGDNDGDLTLLGYLVFFDAPKKTAAKAIEQLKSLHVGIRVLTGDQKSITVSICRRLGIDTRQLLTGAELEKLTEEEWAIRIEQTTVFAELSPKQKMEIVSTLQENGHMVGFLGDGLNDLPAMTEADVGISVDTAAEAVKERADVILMKKDLKVLGTGVLEGRKSFCNMSKYMKITASSNFGNIFSIVIASMFLPFLPIASIQLLLLNLLYDLLCLILPWDHVDEEACRRPVEWSGRTLGRFMRWFGPVSSVFDLVTFVFLFCVLCPAVCGGAFFGLNTGMQKEFIAVFQTGWFLESMWTQVMILYLLRTKKIPLLQSRPSGPVIVVTLCGMFLYTVLTVTPIGKTVGLTGLPAMYFLFLIVVVVGYLFVVTLAKRWYLRKYQEWL